MTNHPLNVTTDSAREGSPRPRAYERGPDKAAPPAFGGLLPKLLYEQYGILENPFGVTPNPRYLYQSKTHEEARSSLIIGIECGIGFQALIASPGMGKTTIMFHVLERFKEAARTAILFQIHGNSHDFLRYLLTELGSEPSDSSVLGLQEAINQLLVREFRSGRRTIIVIDEAQSLDTPILETIRLLSNFETRSEKLLQIILAGQPSLAHKLASSEMAQLRQRIAILTTLTPFGLKETENYIEHRLKVAGYQGTSLFTPAAVRLIWERSDGIPREINTLCFNALLLARAAQQRQIDPSILHEVMADLDLDRLGFNTVRPPSSPRIEWAASGLRSREAAEDQQTTSIDKICEVAVPGAISGADEASSQSSALDVVGLAQFGTLATEEVSTSNGNGVNQAAFPSIKADAEEVSLQPTAFDGVDLADFETLAASVVSKVFGKKVDQAAIPDAKTEAGDVVGGDPVVDRPSLVTRRKPHAVTPAGAQPDSLPSCETKATDSSSHALFALPEPLVIKVSKMPEAKQDLSPEVTSELTSKVGCDLVAGIKPDLKPEVKLEPESGVDSTLDVEPVVAVEAQLLIVLAETEVKYGPVRRSLRTSTQTLFEGLKQRWQNQRATIYLGTSILVFLLVLAGWVRLPEDSREPITATFEGLLSRAGLAEPPLKPMRNENPEIQVWVDFDTGLYYCPGAPLYSKTRDGFITTQEQAQLEYFRTADHKVCQ